MIRALLSLLENDSLQARVMETAKRIRNAYSDFTADIAATFEEEGDSYVFVLNVPTDITSTNVNVEYDDETNMVTVEFSYVNGNCKTKMVVSESLPSNADPDTLSATVVNGVFTLVVDKLPEPAPEPEPVEEAKADSIVVEVKRKNRK